MVFRLFRRAKKTCRSSLSCEKNLYENEQDVEGSQLGFSACLKIASRNNSVQEYLVSKCYTT